MKIVLLDDDAPVPKSHDADIAQLQALTPEVIERNNKKFATQLPNAFMPLSVYPMCKFTQVTESKTTLAPARITLRRVHTRQLGALLAALMPPHVVHWAIQEGLLTKTLMIDIASMIEAAGCEVPFNMRYNCCRKPGENPQKMAVPENDSVYALSPLFQSWDGCKHFADACAYFGPRWLERTCLAPMMAAFHNYSERAQGLVPVMGAGKASFTKNGNPTKSPVTKEWLDAHPLNLYTLDMHQKGGMDFRVCECMEVVESEPESAPEEAKSPVTSVVVSGMMLELEESLPSPPEPVRMTTTAVTPPTKKVKLEGGGAEAVLVELPNERKYADNADIPDGERRTSARNAKEQLPAHLLKPVPHNGGRSRKGRKG